jgi:parallel beta-helix repeat protein
LKKGLGITIFIVTLILLNSFYFKVPQASGTIRGVPNPYPTIQAAINAANPGDTILVAVGTYSEHVVVNKSVTLMGTNRASILTGAKSISTRVVDVSVGNIKISGFTVQCVGTQKGIYVIGSPSNILSNIIITDNAIIGKFNVGVFLGDCINSVVTNNTFNQNYYSLRLCESNYNTVKNNQINASIYYGINLYAVCQHNNITSNTLTNNEYGILLEYSNYNTIDLNQIKSSTQYGIRFSYSFMCLIKGNNIMNNYYGVYVWNCSQNQFYYNNFIDNTLQVDKYNATLTANMWDNNLRPGTKGNYWSDYTGVDDGSGVGRWGEARYAGDHVGDTKIPHSQVSGVSWFGLDWYPLMHPWTPVPGKYPVAIFTYTPPQPIENLPATFNASKSYDPDGIIISYKWDFGDGTPIVEINQSITTHTFTKAGTYLVTLTVKDNDGLTNSTSKSVKVVPAILILDLYTQQPEPYSGRGPNMPSDAYAPQSRVILYAEVTYNYEPVENKLVSFTVKDPNGIMILTRSNSTDQYGITWVDFTLASNATFGIYTAFASVEVSGRFANDTLTFRVGWLIEIIEVAAVDQNGYLKNIFMHGEDLYINLKIQNIAFTTKNATLTNSIIDERGQLIGASYLVNVAVPPGVHEFNILLKLTVPQWSFVGTATVYTNAYTFLPNLGGTPYCPEKSAIFIIQAKDPGVHFLVTFDQTGLDSTATGTVVTVNGNPKGLDDMPFTAWACSSSPLTYSYANVSSSAIGKRFILAGVVGPSSPITLTVTGTVTVTGNYKTQYPVTFDQSGVDSDFAGTVVTIDSFNYNVAGLPTQFWWDNGSSHSFSFASPLVVGGKQYVWNSTSGLSTLQSGTLAIAASGSVVGNYTVQNSITFDQLGMDPDFTGTAVVIDNTPYGVSALPVSFNWSTSSVHSFAFQSPLVVTVNAKQYVWTSTTGLSSLQSGSITATTFGSIIGNYKTQYYFAVASSHDSPTPSSGWFDSGTSITESVTSPVSGSMGTQYVCTGWSGSGSVPASGTASSATFTISAPSSIVWNWKTQYYLTVISPYDSPTPSSGWFDSGMSITESVTSPVSDPTGTIIYVCTGWSGSGSVPASGTASSVTFTIAQASSITWHWKSYDIGLDFTGTVVTIDSLNYGVRLTNEQMKILYEEKGEVLTVPQWSFVGTATVYTNAYSGWLIPYCPEKSAIFIIQAK